jgi:hypothetical protein
MCSPSGKNSTPKKKKTKFTARDTEAGRQAERESLADDGKSGKGIT